MYDVKNNKNYPSEQDCKDDEKLVIQSKVFRRWINFQLNAIKRNDIKNPVEIFSDPEIILDLARYWAGKKSLRITNSSTHETVLQQGLSIIERLYGIDIATGVELCHNETADKSNNACQQNSNLLLRCMDTLWFLMVAVCTGAGPSGQHNIINSLCSGPSETSTLKRNSSRDKTNLDQSSIFGSTHNASLNRTRDLDSWLMKQDERLMIWFQDITKKYNGVHTSNFTTAWKDGMAFLAIIHHYRPELFDFETRMTCVPEKNLGLAFHLAETEFHVPRLIDPTDFQMPEHIDARSVAIYLMELRNAIEKDLRRTSMLQIDLSSHNNDYELQAESISTSTDNDLYKSMDNFSVTSRESSPTNSLIESYTSEEEVKKFTEETLAFILSMQAEFADNFGDQDCMTPRNTRYSFSSLDITGEEEADSFDDILNSDDVEDRELLEQLSENLPKTSWIQMQHSQGSETIDSTVKGLHSKIIEGFEKAKKKQLKHEELIEKLENKQGLVKRCLKVNTNYKSKSMNNNEESNGSKVLCHRWNNLLRKTKKMGNALGHVLINKQNTLVKAVDLNYKILEEIKNGHNSVQFGTNIRQLKVQLTENRYLETGIEVGEMLISKLETFVIATNDVKYNEQKNHVMETAKNWIALVNWTKERFAKLQNALLCWRDFEDEVVMLEHWLDQREEEAYFAVNRVKSCDTSRFKGDESLKTTSHGSLNNQPGSTLPPFQLNMTESFTNADQRNRDPSPNPNGAKGFLNKIKSFGSGLLSKSNLGSTSSINSIEDTNVSCNLITGSGMSFNEPNDNKSVLSEAEAEAVENCLANHSSRWVEKLAKLDRKARDVRKACGDSAEVTQLVEQQVDNLVNKWCQMSEPQIDFNTNENALTAAEMIYTKSQVDRSKVGSLPPRHRRDMSPMNTVDETVSLRDSEAEDELIKAQLDKMKPRNLGSSQRRCSFEPPGITSSTVLNGSFDGDKMSERQASPLSNENRAQFEGKVIKLFNWLDMSSVALEIAMEKSLIPTIINLSKKNSQPIDDESQEVLNSSIGSDNEIVRMIEADVKKWATESENIKEIGRQYRTELKQADENVDEINQLFQDIDERWVYLNGLINKASQRINTAIKSKQFNEVLAQVQSSLNTSASFNNEPGSTKDQEKAEKEIEKCLNYLDAPVLVKNTEELEDKVMELTDLQQNLNNCLDQLSKDFDEPGPISEIKKRLDETQQKIEKRITLLHEISQKYDEIFNLADGLEKWLKDMFDYLVSVEAAKLTSPSAIMAQMNESKAALDDMKTLHETLDKIDEISANLEQYLDEPLKKEVYKKVGQLKENWESIENSTRENEAKLSKLLAKNDENRSKLKKTDSEYEMNYPNADSKKEYNDDSSKSEKSDQSMVMINNWLDDRMAHLEETLQSVASVKDLANLELKLQTVMENLSKRQAEFVEIIQEKSMEATNSKSVQKTNEKLDKFEMFLHDLRSQLNVANSGRTEFANLLTKCKEILEKSGNSSKIADTKGIQRDIANFKTSVLEKNTLLNKILSEEVKNLQLKLSLKHSDEPTISGNNSRRMSLEDELRTKVNKQAFMANIEEYIRWNEDLIKKLDNLILAGVSAEDQTAEMAEWKAKMYQINDFINELNEDKLTHKTENINKLEDLDSNCRLALYTFSLPSDFEMRVKNCQSEVEDFHNEIEEFIRRTSLSLDILKNNNKNILGNLTSTQTNIDNELKCLEEIDRSKMTEFRIKNTTSISSMAKIPPAIQEKNAKNKSKLKKIEDQIRLLSNSLMRLFDIDNLFNHSEIAINKLIASMNQSGSTSDRLSKANHVFSDYLVPLFGSTSGLISDPYPKEGSSLYESHNLISVFINSPQPLRISTDVKNKVEEIRLKLIKLHATVLGMNMAICKPAEHQNIFQSSDLFVSHINEFNKSAEKYWNAFAKRSDIEGSITKNSSQLDNGSLNLSEDNLATDESSYELKSLTQLENEMSAHLKSIALFHGYCTRPDTQNLLKADQEMNIEEFKQKIKMFQNQRHHLENRLEYLKNDVASKSPADRVFQNTIALDKFWKSSSEKLDLRAERLQKTYDDLCKAQELLKDFNTTKSPQAHQKALEILNPLFERYNWKFTDLKTDTGDRNEASIKRDVLINRYREQVERIAMSLNSAQASLTACKKGPIQNLEYNLRNCQNNLSDSNQNMTNAKMTLVEISSRNVEKATTTTTTNLDDSNRSSSSNLEEALIQSLVETQGNRLSTYQTECDQIIKFWNVYSEKWNEFKTEVDKEENELDRILERDSFNPNNEANLVNLQKSFAQLCSENKKLHSLAVDLKSLLGLNDALCGGNAPKVPPRKKNRDSNENSSSLEKMNSLTSLSVKGVALKQLGFDEKIIAAEGNIIEKVLTTISEKLIALGSKLGCGPDLPSDLKKIDREYSLVPIESFENLNESKLGDQAKLICDRLKEELIWLTRKSNLAPNFIEDGIISEDRIRKIDQSFYNDEDDSRLKDEEWIQTKMISLKKLSEDLSEHSWRCEDLICHIEPNERSLDHLIDNIRSLINEAQETIRRRDSTLKSLQVGLKTLTGLTNYSIGRKNLFDMRDEEIASINPTKDALLLKSIRVLSGLNGKVDENQIRDKFTASTLEKMRKINIINEKNEVEITEQMTPLVMSASNEKISNETLISNLRESITENAKLLDDINRFLSQKAVLGDIFHQESMSTDIRQKLLVLVAKEPQLDRMQALHSNLYSSNNEVGKENRLLIVQNHVKTLKENYGSVRKHADHRLNELEQIIKDTDTCQKYETEYLAFMNRIETDLENLEGNFKLDSDSMRKNTQELIKSLNAGEVIFEKYQTFCDSILTMYAKEDTTKILLSQEQSKIRWATLIQKLNDKAADVGIVTPISQTQLSSSNKALDRNSSFNRIAYQTRGDSEDRKNNLLDIEKKIEKLESKASYISNILTQTSKWPGNQSNTGSKEDIKIRLYGNWKELDNDVRSIGLDFANLQSFLTSPALMKFESDLKNRFEYLKQKTGDIRSELSSNKTDEVNSLYGEVQELNDWVKYRNVNFKESSSMITGDKNSLTNHRSNVQIMMEEVERFHERIKLAMDKASLVGGDVREDKRNSNLESECESDGSEFDQEQDRHKKVVRRIKRHLQYLQRQYSDLLNNMKDHSNYIDQVLRKYTILEVNIDQIVSDVVALENDCRRLEPLEALSTVQLKNILIDTNRSLDNLYQKRTSLSNINVQMNELKTLNDIKLSSYIEAKVHNSSLRLNKIEIEYRERINQCETLLALNRPSTTLSMRNYSNNNQNPNEFTSFGELNQSNPVDVQIEEFFKSSVQMPWERCLHPDGNRVPYYKNHYSKLTQWDHPLMKDLIDSFESYSKVRQSQYRIPLKLIDARQLLCLDLVDINVISETFATHSFSSVPVQGTETIDVIQVTNLLKTLYGLLQKKNQSLPKIKNIVETSHSRSRNRSPEMTPTCVGKSMDKMFSTSNGDQGNEQGKSSTIGCAGNVFRGSYLKRRNSQVNETESNGQTSPMFTRPNIEKLTMKTGNGTITLADGREFNLVRIVDLSLNWLLNTFDIKRKGEIPLLSMKIALAVLCQSSLNEKITYLFGLVSVGNDGNMDKEGLSKLLREIALVLEFFQESILPSQGNLDSNVKSCFKKSLSTKNGNERLVLTATSNGRQQNKGHNNEEILNTIRLSQFKAWLETEPQCLLWLIILNKMVTSSGIVHKAKCSSCQSYPITGIRYRCLYCFNFDLCQNCYFFGKTPKSHKPSHPMHEYFDNKKSESIKDMSKIVRNRLKNKQAKDLENDEAFNDELTISNDRSDENNAIGSRLPAMEQDHQNRSNIPQTFTTNSLRGISNIDQNRQIHSDVGQMASQLASMERAKDQPPLIQPRASAHTMSRNDSGYDQEHNLIAKYSQSLRRQSYTDMPDFNSNIYAQYSQGPVNTLMTSSFGPMINDPSYYLGTNQDIDYNSTGNIQTPTIGTNSGASRDSARTLLNSSASFNRAHSQPPYHLQNGMSRNPINKESQQEIIYGPSYTRQNYGVASDPRYPIQPIPHYREHSFERTQDHARSMMSDYGTLRGSNNQLIYEQNNPHHSYLTGRKLQSAQHYPISGSLPNQQFVCGIDHLSHQKIYGTNYDVHAMTPVNVGSYDSYQNNKQTYETQKAFASSMENEMEQRLHYLEQSNSELENELRHYKNLFGNAMQSSTSKLYNTPHNEPSYTSAQYAASRIAFRASNNASVNLPSSHEPAYSAQVNSGRIYSGSPVMKNFNAPSVLQNDYRISKSSVGNYQPSAMSNKLSRYRTNSSEVMTTNMNPSLNEMNRTTPSTNSANNQTSLTTQNFDYTLTKAPNKSASSYGPRGPHTGGSAGSLFEPVNMMSKKNTEATTMSLLNK